MPIQRGEIYFVNLNPVEGREQAGNRPVLVLSRDAINKLPLVVAVVVGTKRSEHLSGLSNQCASLAGRKRLATGNCVSLLSSSLTRSQEIPSESRR